MRPELERVEKERGRLDPQPDSDAVGLTAAVGRRATMMGVIRTGAAGGS
jgi:hypothetical protein